MPRRTAEGKRKGLATPAPTPAKKQKATDGKAANGGRPTNAETLAKAAATTVPDGSIAAMFGARTAVGPKPAATFVSDLKKWNYFGVGGEEPVPQKQLLNGHVLYTMSDPPVYCKLIAVGSDATEETYYLCRYGRQRACGGRRRSHSAKTWRRRGSAAAVLLVMVGTVDRCGRRAEVGGCSAREERARSRWRSWRSGGGVPSLRHEKMPWVS